MGTSDGGSLNVMTFPLEIAEIWTSVLLSAEAMKKVAVSGLILSASVFFFLFWPSFSDLFKNTTLFQVSSKPFL